MTTMTSSVPAPTFMKKLAANEKHVRDQALNNLRVYLRSRKDFSEVELLKLWKGLFYCMWMSDKMRNQQQLARDLADLVDIVPKSMFVPFVDAFWKTMAREWNGIGQLRMDKYLYLVRLYVYVPFRHLARAGWKDEEKLDELLEVLIQTPLNARNAKIPNGMRYHMLDLYLDELEKVAEEHEADLPAEKLLAPIVVLSKDCPTKNIRKEAKELLNDERVRKWLGVEDGKEVEVEEQDANEHREALGADKDQVEDDWGGLED